MTTNEDGQPERTFVLRYNTTISLSVKVQAEDEDQAHDIAWDQAEEYLRTLMGDHRGVTADATLEGIGAAEVEELS